MKNILRYKER